MCIRDRFTNQAGSNEVIRTFEGLAGDPIFYSADFNSTSPLEILPNGQANAVGTFYLYYSMVSGECRSDLLTYSVLFSGLLKKEISKC